MVTEFRKSINSILYQRITGPLSGTFLLAWIITNWKIIYVTLFISQDKLTKNKIDYIIENYWDNWHLICYPSIVTVILIVVYPLFSMGALWLNLMYNALALRIKNKVQKTQVLSVEQSLQLRQEIDNYRIIFHNRLADKDDEIKTLTTKIENYEQKIKPFSQPLAELTGEKNSYWYQEYQVLKNNVELFRQFEQITKKINSIKKYGELLLGDSGIKNLEYFLVNDIIEKYYDMHFRFTAKGEYFYKLYVIEQHDDKDETFAK